MVTLAGYGPISDGIPEPIGDGGDSENKMPRAPRRSTPIIELDKTQPIRRKR